MVKSISAILLLKVKYDTLRIYQIIEEKNKSVNETMCNIICFTFIISIFILIWQKYFCDICTKKYIL